MSKKIILYFLISLSVFKLSPFPCLCNPVDSELDEQRFLDFSTIFIKNKSSINIYAATYLKRTFPSFDCKRIGDIFQISSGIKGEIQRPSGECFYGRKLIIAEDPSELKETFSKTDYKLTVRTNIAQIYGATFHVTQKDNILKIYNSFQWNIIKPIISFVDKIENEILDGLISKISKHPYSTTKAYIRNKKDLPKEEYSFLKERKKIVKKALGKLLDTSLTNDQVPNIAICLSGGSYRAMIGSAGAMLGTQDIGLLDCATYLCSLSGSTWFPSFWTAHNQTLEKCIENLKDKAQTSIVIKPLDLDEVAKMFIKKALFKQKISFIDIYGAALANCLFSDFGKEKHKITLSQTIKFIENAKNPLPIYTAMETTTDYHWLEFTPFEFGDIYLNYYIPSWAFGRKFVNGVSQNFAPEQSFGFLMGIFGAAFSANLDEIIDSLKKPKSRDIYDLLYLITNRPEWEKVRISPATAYNPTYGMQESPMQNIKRLTFMDAGVDGNLPFPPLLRKERNVDIIIAFDFSDGVKYSGTLKKAEKYAKKYNLKFPKIDYESAPKNFVSIFRDEKDPSVPTIIYIPLIKNEDYSSTFDPEKETSYGYCGSINFAYSKKHFEELSGLPKFVVNNYKDIIIDAIKNVIESKSSKKLVNKKNS